MFDFRTNALYRGKDAADNVEALSKQRLAEEARKEHNAVREVPLLRGSSCEVMG